MKSSIIFRFKRDFCWYWTSIFGLLTSDFIRILYITFYYSKILTIDWNTLFGFWIEVNFFETSFTRTRKGSWEIVTNLLTRFSHTFINVYQEIKSCKVNSHYLIQQKYYKILKEINILNYFTFFASFSIVSMATRTLIWFHTFSVDARRITNSWNKEYEVEWGRMNENYSVIERNSKK